MKAARFAALLLCTSCLPTKAVVDPYAFAPKTPATRWKVLNNSGALPDMPQSSKPLCLAEIVDIALRNNAQTRLTWAQARAAAAQYGSAQSSQFPSIAASYDYQRFRSLGGASNSATSGIAASAALAPIIVYQSQWGPQLELSYTLFDFGQRNASAEIAKQALYQADYNHNWQIQTVIQQVCANFYSLQFQKALLKANEADLQTAQITYDATKLELDAGTKDLSDALQAQTQFIQAQIQLITQKQNVINAQATLLTSMGLPATEIVSIQELSEAPRFEQMLDKADTLLAHALEHRDDILAAEANLKSQEASITAAILQFLPTISYDFTYGQTSYTKIGSDGYDFTNLFSLNIPIFSGFSNLNSLKAARAQKEEAEASLRLSQLNVIQEITVAHSNVKTTFESLKLADEYLNVAGKEYNIALEQYKAGTGNILEVVSAQSSLADARAKQAQAINGWFSALIQLSYSAGTLDWSIGSEMEAP